MQENSLWKKENRRRFFLRRFWRGSNIDNLHFAEAYIGVQQNDCPGIGIGLALELQGTQSAGVVCFYLPVPGDQDLDLTEGTVGVNGAVGGDFFAAAEIYGQFAEA